MDALSLGNDCKGSATALAVVILLGMSGLAPIAYMLVPSDRSADTVTYIWADASPMAYPRSSPQVVELPEGDILVIGGVSANGPTRTTEVYDPDTDSWRLGPNMNIARVGHTATLLTDGTVLVTGGDTGSGTTDSAEVIDLSRGWSLYVGSMGFHRSGHAAAMIQDGQVLVTGGTDWLNGILRCSEVYDPDTHAFLPARPMATPRLFFSMHALPDGRVLAAGGDADGTSEVYDPEYDSWGSPVDMASKRYNAGSATLGDGRVLVAGGAADGQTLSTSEVYSPGSNSWAPAGDMAFPRASFAIEQMRSGRMIATGSWGELGATVSCESMCPCDDSWGPEDSMSEARGMHGSATTPNGTVLVIGGRDASGPMSSVEMLLEITEEPSPPPGPCEPIDLVPLVLSLADYLPGHSENGLLANLFAAQAAYESGSLGTCLNIMDAFYNQLDALLRSGHLSEAAAMLLYEGYSTVVECLGGDPLPPLV